MDKTSATDLVKRRAAKDNIDVLQHLGGPFTMQDVRYVLKKQPGRYVSECIAVVQRLERFGFIKQYTGDNYSDKKRRWEKV